MYKKISRLEFGIMSPEQIRKMSVLEIKSPELYDKDGFPVEGGLLDPHLGVVEKGRRCKTCGQTLDKCPGHFGHLELVRPVIHAGYYKKVDFMMNATCKECGKLLLTDNELENLKKQNKLDEKSILSKTKGKTTCPHCGAKKAKIKLDPPTNFYIEDENAEGGFKRIFPNEIREWFEKIPDGDLEKINFKVRPEWFILTVLPIPPINMHPSITLDNGVKSEDDLTFKLVDIIITNNRLKDNINAGTPQLIIEDLWNLLQYNVTTYFNNNTPGVPAAKHRSGRTLKTLIQRIKGKGGIIRHNLMGKRVNFAGRSTISPDIYISVDELGVPEYIANILTVKEKVTDYNKEKLKNLILNSKKAVYVIKPSGARRKITDLNKEILAEELDIGYVVERYLQNGDIVLFNRQPTLHRVSIMAHKVKITKGNTFRLNPTAAAPYNADYDGDDMNMHVPQTPEGIVEASELMQLYQNIISPRYGAPLIAMKEDSIAGAFLLSLYSTKIPRDLAMKYFQILNVEDPPKPDLDNNYYSGKLIFSYIIPKGINLEYDTVLKGYLDIVDENSYAYKVLKKESHLVIEDGVLKKGVIAKKSLGEGVAKLVMAIYEKYGGEAVIDFYNKLNKISIDLITKLGLTVSLNEYFPSEDIMDEKEKILDEFFAKTNKIAEQYKNGTLKKLPGKNLRDSYEKYMFIAASEAKKKIEKLILKDKLLELFNEKPKYNTIAMLVSGARGKTINLTNIVGLWGQIAVREKIPNRGYTDRILPTFKRKDYNALAIGFVTKGFYQGMSARDLYFHAMGGRQGEVDTGVSTKISGYLYRRVSNALRDLIVVSDRSVRSSDNNIIQFTYGDDGVYPQATYHGEVMFEERLEKIYNDVVNKK